MLVHSYRMNPEQNRTCALLVDPAGALLMAPPEDTPSTDPAVLARLALDAEIIRKLPGHLLRVRDESGLLCPPGDTRRRILELVHSSPQFQGFLAFVDASEDAGRRQKPMAPLTDQSSAELVTAQSIRYMYTLCGMQPTGLTTFVAKSVSDEELDQTHAWLESNWDILRGVLLVGAMMGNKPPRADDIGQWFRLAQTVSTDHLGVALRWVNTKRKVDPATLLYDTYPNHAMVAAKWSLWAILGVDVSAYARWLISPRGRDYTASACVLIKCKVCILNSEDGGNAKPTLFREQRGLVVCEHLFTDETASAQGTLAKLAATSFKSFSREEKEEDEEEGEDEGEILGATFLAKLSLSVGIDRDNMAGPVSVSDLLSVEEAQ